MKETTKKKKRNSTTGKGSPTGSRPRRRAQAAAGLQLDLDSENVIIGERAHEDDPLTPAEEAFLDFLMDQVVAECLDD